MTELPEPASDEDVAVEPTIEDHSVGTGNAETPEASGPVPPAVAPPEADAEPVDAQPVAAEPVDAQPAAAVDRRSAMTEHAATDADVSGADVSGADVSDADVSDADVAGADVPGKSDAAPGFSWRRSARRLVHPRVSVAGAVIALLVGLLGFALIAQVKSNANRRRWPTTARTTWCGSCPTWTPARTGWAPRSASLQTQQRQLNSGAQGRQAALHAAQQRADELGILAGTLPATGPGLVITLRAGTTPLDASLVLEAVEELRGAGAEAMQISGDERRDRADRRLDLVRRRRRRHHRGRPTVDGRADDHRDRRPADDADRVDDSRRGRRHGEAGRRYRARRAARFGDGQRVAYGDPVEIRPSGVVRPGEERPRKEEATLIPEDLRYTSDHEWVAPGSPSVRVGITHFAQDALGDIVYVQLPEAGTAVEAGEAFGEVESTKSVSEIYAPISGTVVSRNDAAHRRARADQLRPVRGRVAGRDRTGPTTATSTSCSTPRRTRS